MLEQNVTLRSLSYYKTGGPCYYWFAPQSLDEVSDVVHSLLIRDQLDFFILGAGSNSLISDELWPGVVFNTAQLNKVVCQGTKIIAQAGCSNTEICQLALAHKLSGAAWMNYLPGHIGGTVRMNARCYGGEISQIVSKVTTWCFVTQQLKQYEDVSNLFRGYKDTYFMDAREMILQVELQLQSATNPGEDERLAEFCEQDRKSKAQFIHPSCGCVFKNNYTVGVPSGALLQHAGVMGLQQGFAQVSQYHANFIYNKDGKASSRDILELSFVMREKVFNKFGVWLEYEMEVLGLLPKDLKERFEEHRDSSFDSNALKKLQKEFSQRSS